MDRLGFLRPRLNSCTYERAIERSVPRNSPSALCSSTASSSASSRMSYPNQIRQTDLALLLTPWQTTSANGVRRRTGVLFFSGGILLTPSSNILFFADRRVSDRWNQTSSTLALPCIPLRISDGHESEQQFLLFCIHDMT